MPSKILTELAPELIIQILKSSDRFADLISLSSTSRKMFIIWKMNIDGICEAVVARCVPGYAQAKEVIEAQEKTEGDEHSGFGYKSAVDRAKWIFKDADIAAKALHYFEQWLFDSWTNRRLSVKKAKLTLTEQKHFIRAYYRATILATLSEELLSCQLLLSWNMLDFEQVKDVMQWLGFYCFDSQLRSLDTRFHGIEYWRRMHFSMILVGLQQGYTSYIEAGPAHEYGSAAISLHSPSSLPGRVQI